MFAMQKANAVKRIVAELTLVRMCDESLDASSEALLSRIAKLEDRVAASPSGGTIAVEKPRAKAEKSKTDEPLKVAEPKQTEKPKTENEPVTQTTSPLRQWMEVVERVTLNSPMTAAFLKNTQAFALANGKILIRFENEFSRDMAIQNGGREDLRGALATILKRDIQADDLQTEIKAATEKNALDDIIDASDDDQISI